VSDFILSIDQGTTGTTVAILDKKTAIVSKATVEFPQIFPSPGIVEHNLEDLWKSTVDAIKRCLLSSKINTESIKAIGITNQRETVAFWDKTTGRPLNNAIVWQCRRTSDICTRLKKKGLENEFHEKTGLYLDPYFSGTKIKWFLDNKKSENIKNICAGTIDTFLIFRLTGGKSFLTEPSNASRTLLFNLHSMKWDDDLMRHLNIPPDILPEVKKSSSKFGYTEGLAFLPDGIPITGVLGDQQAAMYGQLCFNRGDVKCTYGTGAFLLLNTGTEIKYSGSNLLTTIAWHEKDRPIYAIEGSVFIAGASVGWLRDGLGIINSSSQVEKLASSVSSSEGVYFVPALTGLGAPYWNPEARGLITGISRGTTAGHLARATLEGIAFQVHDLIRAMEKDIKTNIKTLRVDGGASQNNILMQFQSDILGAKVIRPEFIETTVMGAAFIAGLNSNFWESKDSLQKKCMRYQEYSPSLSANRLGSHLSGWQSAVRQCLVTQ